VFYVGRKEETKKKEKRKAEAKRDDEGYKLLLFREQHSLESSLHCHAAAATALPNLRLCLITVGATLKIDVTPQLLAHSPVVSEAQILPPVRKFETPLTRGMRW
jgi:hypothetical protein